MGLTSLPVLNRINQNNYRTQFMYTNKLHSRELSIQLFLDLFYKNISTERCFSINFFRASQSYFLSAKLKSSTEFKIKNKVHIGEVWYLQYQTWLIITPFIFKPTSKHFARISQTILRPILFNILLNSNFQHQEFFF